MGEIECGEQLRRKRRRRTKWMAIKAILALVMALHAAHNGWWALAALTVALTAAFIGFIIWFESKIIYLDHHGQPLTGRDADRFARLQLRAYEKHHRAH